METIINIFLGHKLDSGFLNLPYTPIYGIGIIIIIIINKILDKYELVPYKKVLLTFFINALFTTIIEYIGGISLDFIFHKSFWNYQKLPLSIGKYISIEISIIWGLLSLIYIYTIKKHSDKLIKKIPNYITYINLVLFSIDLLYTIIFKTK